jgi:hypothetical protein
MENYTGMASRLVFMTLLLPFGLFAQREVSFTATADAKQVALGNYFEVSFTLANAQGQDFRAPDFKEFNQLSGQNVSTTASAVNGVWSQTITYSYYLQPKKVGKATVGPATVRVGSKTYKTAPITVEVVKGKGGGKSPNPNAQRQDEPSTDDDIAGKVFVRLIPSTSTAYLGQQLSLDYKIYTEVGLDNYGINSEPSFKGFYAQPLRSFNDPPVREVYKGKSYTTKVIRRTALFPQQAGEHTIEPVDVAVSVGGRSRGFIFGSFMTHQLRTEAVVIRAGALPLPAPANFTGGVGKFEAVASINKTALTTDDAFALLLTISGTGDIKRVQAPHLQNLRDSFEIYEPRLTDEGTFESQGGLVGKKTFEYLVLPKYAGDYSFAPHFSYFDTEQKTYVDIEAGRFELNVKQGTHKPGTSTVARPDSNQVVAAIRPIKQSFSPYKQARPLWGTPIFLVLLALPIVVFIALLFAKNIREKRQHMDPVLLRQKRAGKVAQQHLAKAKKHLAANESRAFYDEVSRALLGYVCNKLNMPLSELTKDNVSAKLRAHNLAQPQIDRLMRVLQLCETALFAGKDNAAAMNETYQNALGIISDIESGVVVSDKAV